MKKKTIALTLLALISAYAIWLKGQNVALHEQIIESNAQRIMKGIEARANAYSEAELGRNNINSAHSINGHGSNSTRTLKVSIPADKRNEFILWMDSFDFEPLLHSGVIMKQHDKELREDVIIYTLSLERI